MKERAQQRSAGLYKKRTAAQRPVHHPAAFSNRGYQHDAMNNNNHISAGVFSAFVTSETHTSESERAMNMSRKAKEAVKAGETPPALRAMKYLKELNEPKEIPAANITDEEKVGRIQNNQDDGDTGEEAASDFEYDDLKLDLSKLQASAQDVSDSEFDFDEPKKQKTAEKETEKTLSRERPGSFCLVRSAKEQRVRRHSVGDLIDEKSSRHSVMVNHATPLAKRKHGHSGTLPPLPKTSQASSTSAQDLTSLNKDVKAMEIHATPTLSRRRQKQREGTPMKTQEADSGGGPDERDQRKERKDEDQRRRERRRHRDASRESRRRERSQSRDPSVEGKGDHLDGSHQQRKERRRRSQHRDGSESEGRQSRSQERRKGERDRSRHQSSSRSREQHQHKEPSRDLHETLQKLGKTWQLAKDQEQEAPPGEPKRHHGTKSSREVRNDDFQNVESVLSSVLSAEDDCCDESEV